MTEGSVINSGSPASPARERAGARTRRSSRRRKEARPRELIQAALEVFVEHGYAATRIETIGERAGVSKGTAYLYFRDKEELFEAVVRDTLGALVRDGAATLRDFE